MKLRIFSLLAVALLVFACSQEDTVDATQDQQNLTIENTNTRAAQGGFIEGNEFGGFICDPNWTPPETMPFNLIIDKIIHVYWSDDPADWPLGIIDIDCARQEYFRNFCGLYMSTIQPTDPYQETWLRDFDAPDCLDLSKSKDHVDTQSNGDDRVCTGPNCD